MKTTHLADVSPDFFEEEPATRRSLRRVLVSSSVELATGNPWTSKKQSDLSILPLSALRKVFAVVSLLVSTLMAAKLIMESAVVPR